MTVLAEDLLVQRSAGALVTARYRAYLAAAERDSGLPAGSVPRPAGDVSYSRMVETGSSSRRPPYVVVSCPGDNATPVRHGTRYASHIRLGLAAVVAGGSFEEVEFRMKVHAAALRDLLLDHPALGGVAIAATWIGRRHDLLDAERTRTIGATEVLFNVEVRHASDLTDREPLDPDGEAIPWPVIESASVSVFERSAA